MFSMLRLVSGQRPASCSKIFPIPGLVLTMVFLSLLTVTAVESAKHVLEVLRAGGPAVDVILLEVEFPHGRGLKLLKHIMREEKLKQIPVVSKYASADGLCVMFAPVWKSHKCTFMPIL